MRPPPAEHPRMGPDDPAPHDAQAFIAALHRVDLSHFRVVGTYTRYDEAARNALQDARQKILAGFEPPGRKRENHLIWAAPGTGKTYFVQQVAASLAERVRYHEVNLAECTEPEFRTTLGRLDYGQAYLCLVDEVDAKPQEPWPYELLLPYLDAAVERGARFVFVLAASSGASLDEIKQRIAARPKGTDLLSRIPTGHEHVIGPMSLGDRLLIVLSQLRQAGVEAGRDIRAIEKFGLYYVALNPRLANARQLREFAVRAVERVPKTDDRVKYDHLFVPGDPENKAFWVQAFPIAERLVNSFVILTGDGIGATLPSVYTPPSHGAADAVPAVWVEAAPRTNLPRELTSFVGREREIEEVKRLLPTTALLTLHGPGGCGKTRLALRVAADLADQYPDGVWVAELAALVDPCLVPKAVATALDLPEQPGRPLTETLKDSLRRKSLLLVLDNCEHLVSPCAELAGAMLRACPTLRILATSREPLGIPGETVWDVPSLSVPESSSVPSPGHLGRFDGVRLFVERAATSKPGFALTAGNAAAVAKVCSQLEGIPLAIELAAARVRVLTMEQIAARLDDRFRLLTGGGRTALPRHQTLRATMDWSYGLLSEQEQVLLRRLSVFTGGWTVEAAEAVCTGGGIDATGILDLLMSLADKSLVIAKTQGGEARYRVLETVRQYCDEKLQSAGERTDVRQRHCDWFLRLAEQAAPELVRLGMGRESHLWLERLEIENDNLRAALEWSKMGPNGNEAEIRLAGALWRFWFLRGYWNEGRAALEAALERSSDAAASSSSRALRGAAWLAWHQGDYGRSVRAAETNLGVCRELGDKEGIAWSLHIFGLMALRQDDYGRATAFFTDSIALGRELADKWWISIELAQLGQVARDQGDYVRATAVYAEGLTLAREVGEKWLVAYSLMLLGDVALDQDDYGGAISFFRESLALLREVGDRGFVTLACLAGLASLACNHRDYERAARLFGVVEASRKALGREGSPAVQPKHGQRVASTRAALGEVAFAAASAKGRAMTLAQAVEYAVGRGRQLSEHPQDPTT